MDICEKRIPKRENTQMVPQPVSGETGLEIVDTTWEKIQPNKIEENVRTVDEIVNEFQEKGFPVIDAPNHCFLRCIHHTRCKEHPAQ